MEHFHIRALPAGSLLRLGLVVNLGIWLPISLLLGVTSLFGLDSVRWGANPVHGAGGVLVALLLGAIFAAFGTVMVMLGGLIARLLGPLARVSIAVKDQAPPDSAN